MASVKANGGALITYVKYDAQFRLTRVLCKSGKVLEKTDLRKPHGAGYEPLEGYVVKGVAFGKGSGAAVVGIVAGMTERLTANGYEVVR